ncbi:MAG: DUF3500 domain-containing protein, partial [Verrucomicrobiota bacterium]
MRLLIGILTVVAGFSLCFSLAQEKGKGKGGKGGKGKGKGGASRFVEAEKNHLAEEFVGITADGQPEEGLFEIKSTGVSTLPVKEAAENFIACLTESQKAETMFTVADEEWRRWANQHALPRQGVSFE